MAKRGDFTEDLMRRAAAERQRSTCPRPNGADLLSPVGTTLRLAGREQKRQEGGRQMQDHAPPRFPGADAGSRGFGEGS